MLNIEKKIEGRKRKLSPARHQICIVPSQNHEPSSELLRFVRGVCPNFRQTGQFFLPYHLGGMTLNQARFPVFLIFFLELKCHVTQCIHMHVSMS